MMKSNIIGNIIQINENIDTMTMWIPDIATRDGPRYRAIADAIGAAIRDGTVCAGERLPPQRELAWKLGVTVGTVSRGYALAVERGLLSGQVGRGTYVLADDGRPLLGRSMTAPAENDSFDMSVNAAGVTGRDVALAATLREIANSGDLEALLGYMPTAGHLHHRAALAPWLKRQGIAHARPESIVLTTGAAQALMSTLAVLTNAGEPVMVERLTYTGLIEAAHFLNRPLIGLEMDSEGVIPDALECAAVDQRARLAILVPTIQNPTATVMSEQRRREIVSVAEKHDLLLVEDDVYGNLPESQPTPLAALAPDRTIYLSSASKCLAPGLRAGWILAPDRLLARLANYVFAASVTQSGLTFEIVARWVESGVAERLVQDLRSEMVSRQRLTAEILGEFDYATHESALHIWLNLSDRWRGGVFAEAAAARKIRIMPGSSFVVGDDAAPRAVRISISRPPDRTSLSRYLHVLRDILLAGPTANRTMV